MVLGDSLIRKLNLITPFNEENLQHASYDLTAGEITQNIDDLLLPYETVLISTKERVELPNNVAAFIKTRSSLARMGLIVGDVGGWIDPGYHGNITILVANIGKKEINIEELGRIAQIVFLEVEGSTGGYEGNYQDSEGIVKSIFDE